MLAQSHQSFLAALELYKRRPDKDYSLVDCVGMVTMRSRGLTEALTTDKNFVQEGFVALLREIN